MKNKENISYIVIFVLVIALIVSFAKIHSLESNIALLRNDQDSDRKTLEQQISNIYKEVDERMKKHASLFSYSAIEYGKDVANNRGPVTISVVPKTITDDMVLNISYDGQTVAMNKTPDGKYAGTLMVDMFKENVGFPLVTIESKGETKTEYLTDLYLSEMWPDFIPSLRANVAEDVSSTRRYKDGKLPVRLLIGIGYDVPNNGAEIKFEDVYLLVKVNDKEIDRKDMNDKFNTLTSDTEDAEFVLEETYEVSKSDKLSVYVVGQDELGFIHEQNVYNWVHPDENGAQMEPAVPANFKGESIYDKDGNKLYGME